MKKIGLLALALVLALGALGVGFASWTDTVFIEGQVCTGDVCIEFDDGRWGEIVCSKIPGTNIYPDKNWGLWIPSTSGNTVSCPEGYEFDDIDCVDKDVAYVTFNATYEDGHAKILEVTIHDAYPHFLADISFWIHNCGTIPVILQEPIITQSDFLLIEYGDNIGAQLHYCDSVEISLLVGVVQHRGYEDASGAWVVDDESQDLLPMNSCDEGVEDITFTIEIPAEQWAECPSP